MALPTWPPSSAAGSSRQGVVTKSATLRSSPRGASSRKGHPGPAQASIRLLPLTPHQKTRKTARCHLKAETVSAQGSKRSPGNQLLPSFQSEGPDQRGLNRAVVWGLVRSTLLLSSVEWPVPSPLQFSGTEQLETDVCQHHIVWEEPAAA
jgi:hypothetical protein